MDGDSNLRQAVPRPLCNRQYMTNSVNQTQEIMSHTSGKPASVPNNFSENWEHMGLDKYCGI